MAAITASRPLLATACRARSRQSPRSTLTMSQNVSTVFRNNVLHHTLCGEDDLSFNYILDGLARDCQKPGEPGEVALVFRGGSSRPGALKAAAQSPSRLARTPMTAFFIARISSRRQRMTGERSGPVNRSKNGDRQERGRRSHKRSRRYAIPRCF